jgi:lysozyme family protein
MTASQWPYSFKLVLAHEGGYVNHPADPGGATNKGVTQATYNAYRRAKGEAVRDVRQITDAELSDIYKSRYWNAVRGDELPTGVVHAMYDFGVNSGPSRSIKFVQALVGVDDDGVLGPKTLAAIKAMPARDLINRLCDARLAFLRGLSTWPTFGRGWTTRVERVRREALAVAGQSVPPDVPIDPEPPEPDETETVMIGVPSEPSWLPAFIAHLVGFFTERKT